ncbi:MAG: sodium:calcium antiporter [Bacteroides sp.]
MMPIKAIVFLLLGLIFLPVASQLLIKGVQNLRQNRKQSRWNSFLFLALGAVLPELVLGIFCSYSYHPQLILSTVIASSALNVLIALPFLAFATPVVFDVRKGEIRNVGLLLLIAVLFFLLTSDTLLQGASVDLLSRGDGLILLLMLPIVFMLTPSSHIADEAETELPVKPVISKQRAVLSIVIGLVIIPLAGWLAVSGAVELMYFWAVPADKVGILAIAIITALPEVTMAVQSRKNAELRSGLHNDLVLSSSLNLVLVLGVVALLGNVAAYEYMSVDSLFLVAGAFALLLFIVIGKGWQVEKHEGIMMMFLYLCFFAYVLFREDVMHLF